MTLPFLTPLSSFALLLLSLASVCSPTKRRRCCAVSYSERTCTIISLVAFASSTLGLAFRADAQNWGPEPGVVPPSPGGSLILTQFSVVLLFSLVQVEKKAPWCPQNKHKIWGSPPSHHNACPSIIWETVSPLGQAELKGNVIWKQAQHPHPCLRPLGFNLLAQ